jgi:hypothetical protein
MFTYTTGGVVSDENIDAVKVVNNKYQVTTRAAGAAEATLGAAGTVGGIAVAPAACTTGVGCVADAIAIDLSIDAYNTGWKQFVSGEYQETTTHQILVNAGLSEDAANYAETLLGVGSGTVVVKNVIKGTTTKVGATLLDDTSEFPSVFNTPNSVEQSVKNVDNLGTPITRKEAEQILTDKHTSNGLSLDDAKYKAQQELESFSGQIYKKEVSVGDKYVVTHSDDGYVSGTYVMDKESAGMTSKELQEKFALPKDNKANTQTEITVTESHTTLTGKAADKSSEPWAYDHATGGGTQIVVDPKKTNRDEIFGE